MTITEFLRARLNEDAALVEKAFAPGTQRVGHVAGWAWFDDDGGEYRGPLKNDLPSQYVSDCDEPEHMRREIEAKRRILDAYEELRERRDDFAAAGHRTSHTEAGIESYEYALRALAAVYADHPGYRQEWAPQ